MQPHKMRKTREAFAGFVSFHIGMASQEGFEPPTTRLEGECSIRLSYWDKM